MQTTTTLTNNLHSFYFKMLLESAEGQLRLAPLAETKLHPKSTGKDSYVLKYGNVLDDTNELSEGVTPTESSIATNKYTITIKPYGSYIGYSDFAAMTTIDDISKSFAKRLGYHAARKMDSIIRDHLIANATSNKQYGGTGITTDTGVIATNTFVAQDALKGVRIFKLNDAPARADGSYIWVVNPGASMDIQADTSAGGFIELNKYVSGLADKVMKGEVGKVYGARVVESSNMTGTANVGSVNVYSSLLLADGAFVVTKFDKDAIEMINKQPGSAGAADPLNQKGTVGYKMYFGVKYVGGTFSNANAASPDLCIQIRAAITGG